MPPGRRVARSSVASTKTQNAKNKSQKRSLDAFSIASHSAPQNSRIRQHRLGESVNDGPRQKRRRLQDDEEDDEDEEHAADSGRRRGPDEEIDEGSDSEGNEWRMGGPIGDDSDSSLDSDEAFGESDEERFEGFTFRGSSTTKSDKKKKTKARNVPREMDLDEGSEGEEGDSEEDDFGDEAVDLATMLDDNSESEEEQPRKRKSTQSANDEDEDMSDDEDEEDDDDDDDEDEDSEDSDDAPSEAESDDDADPTKLSKLQDLITSLDSDQLEKRITGRSADVHESQQPSAFGLSASQKLKVSDLLPTVTDPALRKSLKLLSSDKTSKRSSIPGKLDAPLPKRQQDRLDRTVATQRAKETLDRWRDTVVQNRRAEFLSFPLKDPNASEPLGKNTMIAVQQEKPQNDLETAIQNILVESGLTTKGKPGDEESQLQEYEELKVNRIPIEEVMARRADLRKARELLFREESKSKRIKKIKSKAYRRVHRREREREAEKDREFREAEGIESDEDEKEKRDRKRAEERMGTKHRSSKWAKGMKKSGRTVWDDDARDSMVELAQRNEDLRKRIEGKDVRERDSDDSDFSEDDDDEDDLDDEDAERKRLQKKLDKLDEGDNEKSKLGGMLFMQRAEAARKAQNDEDMERMRRDLAGEASASEEDPDAPVGRRSFGPKAKDGVAPQPKPKPLRGELEENPASDEEDDRVVDDEAEIIVDRPATNGAAAGRKARPLMQKPAKATAKEPETNGADVDNEWLSTATKSKRCQEKEEELVVSTKVKPAKEAAPPPSKSTDKQVKAGAKQSVATSTNGWTTIPYTGANGQDSADADDNEEPDNLMISEKDKQAQFHQRAFAGDDVAVDFEAEKAAQMEDEDDKVTSTHLPGWGSWAGDGLTKATRRQNQRIAHNPLRKHVAEGVKAANRRDANKKNVVISEAQQRKSKKYLASQLPHQFERGDQYERSLRIPVGPEWTTKETFQRNTRPRVVVKQGIIAPMEKPLL
ncbi:Utp14 protein-domain-containing protein [Delphinella strobiligena]|nr:Utp14 protein-domain-containing protein [Delphinella strobiligena]